MSQSPEPIGPIPTPLEVNLDAHEVFAAQDAETFKKMVKQYNKGVLISFDAARAAAAQGNRPEAHARLQDAQETLRLYDAARGAYGNKLGHEHRAANMESLRETLQRFDQLLMKQEQEASLSDTSFELNIDADAVMAMAFLDDLKAIGKLLEKYKPSPVDLAVPLGFSELEDKCNKDYKGSKDQEPFKTYFVVLNLFHVYAADLPATWKAVRAGNKNADSAPLKRALLMLDRVDQEMKEKDVQATLKLFPFLSSISKQSETLRGRIANVLGAQTPQESVLQDLPSTATGPEHKSSLVSLKYEFLQSQLASVKAAEANTDVAQRMMELIKVYEELAYDPFESATPELQAEILAAHPDVMVIREELAAAKKRIAEMIS